jgi:hypothetical protein
MERSKLESKYYAGCSHHRWLIELNDEKVKFYFKHSVVHASFMFLEKPRTFSEATTNFIWKDNIEGYEHITAGSSVDTFIGLIGGNNVILAEKYNLRIRSNNYYLRKFINILKKIIIFRFIVRLCKKIELFQNILNIK